MDIIADIFAALGEATAIAAALNEPVQTVHSWKANGSIPRWRRKPLLELKPVDGMALSPEAIQYLHSDARRLPQSITEQAAA